MPTSFTVTPEILAAIVGALVSLLFSYVPGLNTWFAGLDNTLKRLIMLGLLVIVALAVFALGCAQVVVIQMACTQQGAIELAWILVSAIMANQSVYQLTPKAPAVIKIFTLRKIALLQPK